MTKIREALEGERWRFLTPLLLMFCTGATSMTGGLVVYIWLGLAADVKDHGVEIIKQGNQITSLRSDMDWVKSFLPKPAYAEEIRVIEKTRQEKKARN